MPCRHQFSMIASDGLHPGPVEAVERPRRQVAVELRPVGRDLGLESVEHFLGQAARIGFGLHHQRRYRADQHGLRHPALAVPGQVAHHFAATGRVADVDRVLEIEVRRHRREVVGVVVHVVAAGGLGRPPVTAPVVGDDAIAVLEEEHHLRVPVIGRQGPAMAEHDGLTISPVLVEDLRAIRGGDRAHGVLLPAAGYQRLAALAPCARSGNVPCACLIATFLVTNSRPKVIRSAPGCPRGRLRAAAARDGECPGDPIRQRSASPGTVTLGGCTGQQVHVIVFAVDLTQFRMRAASQKRLNRCTLRALPVLHNLGARCRRLSAHPRS